MKAFLFLASAVGWLAACTQIAYTDPAGGRALFVWNTAAIRSDRAAQAHFFKFIDAPFGASSCRIKTVFFDGVRKAQFDDPAAMGLVKDFLRTSHTRGIRVIYLCGDASWATPAHQADALDYLHAVLEFNRGGKANERYDGIAFDVEPYLLPGWPSQDIQHGYLLLLDNSESAIRASGRKLSLTAIIPRWFSNPEFAGLDREVIDRTDSIIIMDYVNTPDRIAGDAAKELSDAAAVHKPVWVAVETGQLTDTPRATFFGRSNSQMESVLAQAMPTLRRQPSFAGYAIHSLQSYEPMKP